MSGSWMEEISQEISLGSNNRFLIFLLNFHAQMFLHLLYALRTISKGFKGLVFLTILFSPVILNILFTELLRLHARS